MTAAKQTLRGGQLIQEGPLFIAFFGESLYTRAMDVFFFCVNGVLPVVLTVFAGYGLRQMHIIDDTLVKKGARLCVDALIPISIFCSVRQADPSRSLDVGLVVYCLSALVSETLLAIFLVPRFVKTARFQGAVVHSAFRSNVLILGYPLALNLFGEEGGLCMIKLLPLWVIYFNLAGVPATVLFDPRPGSSRDFRGMVKKTVKNPLIISSVAGLVFRLLSIPVPVVIDQTLKGIGGISTALALLLLGGQFRFSSMRANLRVAAGASAVRLVLSPLIFTTLAVMLGFRGVRLGVLFIVFGAPAATVTYIMAASLGTDEELAGQIVVLSTALCGVTLFLGTFLLKISGLI